MPKRMLDMQACAKAITANCQKLDMACLQCLDSDRSHHRALDIGFVVPVSIAVHATQSCAHVVSRHSVNGSIELRRLPCITE